MHHCTRVTFAAATESLIDQVSIKLRHVGNLDDNTHTPSVSKQQSHFEHKKITQNKSSPLILL